MNKLILVGRFTKDPEIRMSGNATIAKFSLAVDRKYKRDGEPEADFFNCTAFNKTAEFVEKYCTKGMKMIIEGRVQNDNYEKDGVKHYSVAVIVENIEFTESKKSGTSEKKAEEAEEFVNVSSDELPFS
jgi:single-strand DNA-binding protein